MFDRVLLIDKPAGMTSFGVVARVRRVLSQEAGKKVKVGHTGTLDPFATGLMIIVTGVKCRDAGLYSKLDKVYEVEMTLGTESTTGDPEGELSTRSETVPSRGELEAAFLPYVGDILQTPPRFSAIKVNGQRSYKLARAGIEVVLEARPVSIYNIEVTGYDYPLVRFRTHVSSGTYIRSLVSDVGERLGTGAYTSGLRRTRIAEHDVSDALTLAEFMGPEADA